MFDVDFPETNATIQKTESRDPEFDNIVVTNWILKGKNGNNPYMYFVATNKIPEAIKKMSEEDLFYQNTAFQAMLTGSATKLGGENFKFKEIKYNDFEGMESICDVFDGEGIIRSRVYMTDKDLFMVSAVVKI